jgi:TolA-binding protein
MDCGNVRTKKNVMKKRMILILALAVTAAPAFGADTDEQERFAEGESFYYAKNYALALESYTAFTAAYPISELLPDVQYRRALCLLRLQRYDESLDLFEKILKRYRATRYLDLIPFWQGMARFYKAEYSKALDRLAAFLAKPQDPALTAQARYYQAVCQTETADYAAAQATVFQFLVEHPKHELADHAFLLLTFIHFKRNNPDAIIALNADPRAAALPEPLKDKFLMYYAGALLSRERPEEAKTIYNKLLSSSGPEIQAVALAKLFSLAQQSRELERMEELVRRAEQSLADNPTVLVDLWTNIGIAGYAAGRLESAEYYFTRAWNMRDKVAVPEAVPLYLSEVFSKRGNNESALSVLEEYLAGRERQAEGVLFRLGHLADKNGDYARAVSYLEDFLKFYPKSLRLPEAQYLLAYACYRTGALDRGLEISQLADSWPAGQELYAGMIRLRAKLLLKKGEAAQAAAALNAYLSGHPDDLEARRDLVAVLFMQKKYKDVIAGVKGLAIRKSDPELYVTLKYYEGLAYISLKEYALALRAFAEFTGEYIERRGTKEIYPSVVFYRGWAFYRLGKPADAAPLFKLFTEQYPRHPLYSRALYLAGWCLYTLGNFKEAVGFFETLSRQSGDKETVLKGAFFMAKSLVALNRTGEALKLFSAIFELSPSSPFAPNALFEYARINAEQGRPDAAGAAWERLARTYPKHDLAEDALYNRAERFYQAKDYRRAVEAFSLYRDRFPKGGQVDASFYWGGVAAFEAGDRSGALRQWERVIQDFRDSSFRSEALKKAAETYRLTGANDKALAAWQELAGRYPKEARIAGAEDRIRELRYLVMGYTGEEARLTAAVEREGGKNSRTGRLAMLDLAAYYLDDGAKAEAGLSLILTVNAIKTDKVTRARAQYLLGDYYALKKDYTKAGNEYLQAALIDTSNREQMARAVYQSARMMKLSGDAASTRELVGRLTKNFPDSRWTAEGKKLLEGLK